MLESDALVNGQRVRLGNDGDNVDNLGQLLEDNNVNGLQTKIEKCHISSVRRFAIEVPNPSMACCLCILLMAMTRELTSGRWGR